MPKTMPRMIALRVNSGGDSPGGTYGRNSGTLAIWTSLRRGGHQVGGDYMQAVFTSLRAAGIFTLSFRGAKRRGIPGFSTEGSLASLERSPSDNRTAPPGPLHPSRPSEPDRDFAPFDDDRYASATGDADHPIELPCVALDVDVGKGDFSTRVVLTGRSRVGSGVLSENLDPRRVHASLRPRS